MSGPPQEKARERDGAAAGDVRMEQEMEIYESVPTAFALLL